MEQTKKIERFRIETIIRAVENVTNDFYIMDALSDYLELLRDFSGCIDNIQNECYIKDDKQPEDVLQVLKDMYNANRLNELVWKTSHIEKVCKSLETIASQVQILKDCINK